MKVFKDSVFLLNNSQQECVVLCVCASKKNIKQGQVIHVTRQPCRKPWTMKKKKKKKKTLEKDQISSQLAAATATIVSRRHHQQQPPSPLTVTAVTTSSSHLK